MLTYDILFLIPTIWTGPIIAPLIISITFIILALIIFNLNAYGKLKPIKTIEIIIFILGSILVFYAFIADFLNYIKLYMPILKSVSLTWNEAIQKLN